MRILAFDTSLSGCSAAFYDGEVRAFEIEPMERGQAEQLVPMIGRVLEKSGAEYASIEKIVTTVGPGAFTGLRIGLSTARALGLALGVAVVGVNTLDVIARKFLDDDGLQADETLCVLLDTRRSDFYTQFHDANGGGMEMLEAAEIERQAAGRRIVFIGDALDRFRALCPARPEWRFVTEYELPDPRLIAAMSASGAATLPPEPLYLRGADVSQSKKKTIVIQKS